MTLEEWEAGPPNIDLEIGQVLTILSVIADGWRAAIGNDELTPTLKERKITRWLIGGMRRCIKDRGASIARGTETPRGAVPDICISFRRLREEEGEHEPHAVVECKRVAASDPTLCRRYVRHGIDRFASSKYGAKSKYGFMVGYVVAGSTLGCVDGINRYLANQKREPDCLRADVLPVALAVWSSRHTRKAVPSIEIKHQFLAFPTR